MPDELRAEAASALELAGRRALEREANRRARRLLLRSVELEPTLMRRFCAAKAAWRLWELPAASVEMEAVREQAREAGDRTIEGLALVQLAEIVLNRNADVEQARRLGGEALELLARAPGDARSEALTLMSSVGWWEGDLTSVERYIREALDIAREAARPDLESLALVELAAVHLQRLELGKAEEALAASAALAEASGSLSAGAWVARIRGSILLRKGRFDEAAQEFRAARELFDEIGAASDAGRTQQLEGVAVWQGGDPDRAEQIVREAVRALLALEERAKVIEAQRTLAELLVAKGQVEEAERWALSALETVGMQDMMSRSNVLHGARAGSRRAAAGRRGRAPAARVDRHAFRDGVPKRRAGAARRLCEVPTRTGARRRGGHDRGPAGGAPSAGERGPDHLTRLLVRGLRHDRRGALEAGERFAERVRA